MRPWTRRRALLAALLALPLILVGVAPALATPTATGLVVGDSVVKNTQDCCDTDAGIPLRGYPSWDPNTYFYSDSGSHIAGDDTQQAKTIVLNWNGNSRDNMSLNDNVTAYSYDLASTLNWYFAHGATHVILVAALPSLCDGRAGSYPSTPSCMLGNPAFNTLYQSMTGGWQGRVTYSEAPARALSPTGDMLYSYNLNGQQCRQDYIHLTPYCAAIYASALRKLAGGN